MEIGSIFEISPESLFTKQDCNGITFPFMKNEENMWNLDFFNTGRAAIEAYMVSNKLSECVWLPSFTCTSVIDAIKRAGKNIRFYAIDDELQPDMEFLKKCELKKGDILYVMQYFGVKIKKPFCDYIDDMRKQDIVIFEDITMSLLSDKDECFAFGDYVLGSVRKWDAIPDGAFIASKHTLKKIAKQQPAYDYTLYYFAAQIMKNVYLRTPEKYDKNEYLKLSGTAIEALFSDYSIRDMSEISYKLLCKKWGGSCLKRKKNYDVLYELLKNISQVRLLPKIEEGMIPLGMFLIVKDRDALLNYLIENGIYCNVHWRPNEGTEQFDNSSFLSRHCITIPCDQRYDEDHMIYIFNVISEFYEGERI